MTRPKNGENKKCIFCEKVFYVPKCYLESKKFCSIKCFYLESKESRTGKNNPNWKGIKGKYAYSNLHKWIGSNYGKPELCRNIECKKSSIKFEWANITGIYERDIKNYIELCRSCHTNFDRYKKKIKLNNETYTIKTKTANKFRPLLQAVC